MNASKRTSKKTNDNSYSRRLREGLLIFTLAISLYFFIALFSYHSVDPSWSHVTTNHLVQNAGGVVGAWLSDFFLYLCGYLAYVFPLMLCYAAWMFYSQRSFNDEETSRNTLTMTLKIIGFLLILIAGSSFLTMNSNPVSNSFPFNAGGILGSVIGNGMLNTFNRVGSTLILTAMMLIGITLFTGISWFSAIEKLGATALFLCKNITRSFLAISWESLWERIKSLKSKPKPLISQAKQFSQTLKKPSIATPAKRIASIVKTSIDEAPFVKSKQKPRKPVSNAMPTMSLLEAPTQQSGANINKQQLEERSKEVEMRLLDFNIEARVVAVYPGPVVTRFELDLAAGTKVSKITTLAKDLARSLSVVSVRVVEVIPGKSYIGIELPNENREMVTLQEVLDTPEYHDAKSALSLALGKDIAGRPVIVDLAKMPHLLVAGTTGSGKSVGLNAMLLSLLYKSTPQELRLIMIDPKMLELAVYDNIPHLLAPVVTDMKDAAKALRWSVVEMERRYRLMAALGVRNIAGYNAKVKEAQARGKPILDPLFEASELNQRPEELQTLPQIVILADEFADMMVVVGKKVETLIARLAQKARAAGIHLILATQRPSVDVITGLIKANIPTRIAFQVSSKVDSRTILDQQGAEQLLGHGDMLYLAPGAGVPKRVHGAFVDDDEVHRVVAYLKSNGEADYLDDVLDDTAGVDTTGYTDATFGKDEGDNEQDPLYDEAVHMVAKIRKVSISSIQRRFKIGYNRAACIVEAMESAGVVSPMDGNSPREVLVPPVE